MDAPPWSCDGRTGPARQERSVRNGSETSRRSMCVDERRKLVVVDEQARRRLTSGQRVGRQDDGRARCTSTARRRGSAPRRGRRCRSSTGRPRLAQASAPSSNSFRARVVSRRRPGGPCIALARLGRGDPRPVGDAAHALALHHEGVEPLGQPLASGVAGDHAGQHRVVPVHGPAVLGGEGVGLVADHPGEASSPTAPSRVARAPSSSAMAIGAAQAVADRRRAGEQGEAPRRAVGVAGPQDLAPGRLQLEHELDGGVDGRPHRLEERRGRGTAASGATRRRRRRRRSWRRACPARPGRPGSTGATSRRARWVERSQSKPRSASARRPPSMSAMSASVWFHGSAWPPGNHGTMPRVELPLGDVIDGARAVGAP